MKTITIKQQSIKKEALFFLIMTIFALAVNAQVEIGVRVGGSNYLGDSSPMYPVLTETNLSTGVFCNVHVNNKVALRAQFNKYVLSGNDANLIDPVRASRGLSFSTALTEAGVGMEYYLRPFEKCDKHITPYVFTGLSFIKYYSSNSNVVSNADIVNSAINRSGFSVPFGIGAKKILYKGIVLGAELQCTKTFTDALDYSAALGNQLFKDWYLFGGFTLSYFFGKCEKDRRVSRYEAMPCPILYNSAAILK